MALNTLTLANSNLSGSGAVAVNGLTAGSTVTLTNNPEGAFFFDGANLIYNLVSSYPRKLAPVLLEQLGEDQGQTVFAVNVAGAFAPGPGNGVVDTAARAAAADAKANPTLATGAVAAVLPSTGVTPTQPPVSASSSLVGTLGNGPGTLVSNVAGAEIDRIEFGLAWLFRWLNGLKAGTAMKVGMIGDSNTESYRGPILQALLAQVPGITVVNYGVGNTTLKQFNEKTGPYASNGKALDAVLAAGHDLIICNFDGTNTPAIDAGGSPQSFSSDLDAFMTALRASANGSPGRCGVVLCTSSAQADGTINVGTSWKRDMLFKAYTRQIVAAAAKTYNCAFFDLGARLPEPIVDFATGSVGVNTWMTDNHLHPINAHNDILAQSLFEYLVPSIYRNSSNRLNVNIAQSFSLPNTAENMSTKRVASHVYMEGRLNHAGISSLAKDSTVFSVNSAHRPRVQVWNAQLQLFDGSTTPMTTVKANIQPDGQVKIAEAFSAFTVTSIRMRSDWECVGY